MSRSVIVVGGGLAGASLARGLAQAGVDVLERERNFKDRVRGEQMHPWGVAEARALGIYELIKSCGTEVRLSERQVAGTPRRAPRDLVDTSPHGAGSLNFYHPEMQTALLVAAEHAGAAVRRAVTVLEVIPGDPPRVRTREDGREQIFSANLVIGADGRDSRCRQWAGFQVEQS
jgi:2-polyprenyl-6-methoxyphenol hydroxylase-like FAD-dependent oxidoreductase